MINFILHNNNLSGLVKQLEKLDQTQKFDVKVRPWKSKRSTEQNSRYWKLLTEFGAHLGYTQDEMHEIMRYKFLRNMIEINGESVPLLSSTTKLNTAQFADYMDSIERFGHGLGYFFQE